MIQHILKLVLICMVISCSPTKNKNITITCKTDRVGDVILIKIDPLNNQIDTTSIKKGSFKFSKNINEEELFRLKFFDGTSFDILTYPGENINIKYKKNDLSITGSEGSSKLMELDSKLNDLIIIRDSLAQELQKLSQDTQYEKLMLQNRLLFIGKLEEHKLFIKKFIDTNINSKICLIALYQTYGQSAPVLNIDEDIMYYEKVLDGLKENFPTSNHITLLSDQIHKAKPLSIGAMAPTFTLPNEQGDSIKLSEFIGKIVLLDFWASWCRPCRIENPKLVSLHDKYSTKGFEIISISLDGTSRQKNPKKDWIEAIQKDKLDWVHLSELNGWQTFVRELYNFNSIPYTVLIDEDGRIIGKNLKEDLESSIKKALNDE